MSDKTRVIDPIPKIEKNWSVPGAEGNPVIRLERWGEQNGKPVVMTIPFECLGRDSSDYLLVEEGKVDEDGRHTGERVRMPVGGGGTEDGTWWYENKMEYAEIFHWCNKRERDAER